MPFCLFLQALDVLAEHALGHMTSVGEYQKQQVGKRAHVEFVLLR
jgi:hypothetical protein